MRHAVGRVFAKTKRAHLALGVVAVLATGATSPRLASAANELCGTTITSSTTLTADQACTGDGLIIVGDGLTIDLGGHRLSGDGDSGDIGIDVSGAPHVTIRNGTIHGFGVGVGSQGPVTELAKLSNLTLRANTTYGAAPAAKTVVIDKCSFLENDTGLRSDSPSLKVTSTTFLANTNNGAEVDAAVSTFKNIVAVGNGFDGLDLSGSGGKTTVQSSLLAQNGLDGIFIGDEFLAPPGKITVSKNTIVGNGTFGIERNGTFDPQHLVTVTISGNLIAGNTLDGISIGDDADGTVVSGNRIIGNGDDGIDISPTADGVLVKGNTIVGNSEDGVENDNPTATFAGNVLNANHDAGIATSAAVDGGGNRARANGQGSSPCSDVIACPRAFNPKSGPVTPVCGQHVSASITLGADLSCNASYGLVVDADDITINLNGHQLDGGASLNTVAIDVNDHSGVTITNGIVQRFQVGISGGSGDNLKLVNVEMRENSLGGVYVGHHLIASKLSVVANDQFGFEVSGFPEAVAKISDSFFVANGDEGFGSRGQNTFLKNVVAVANDEAGVRIGPGGAGRLQGGIVAGNVEDGVRFIPGLGEILRPWTVQKALIVGNGMDGVVTGINGTGLVLDGNVIAGNGLHGIAVTNTPDQTTIKKNTLVGNVSDGVFIDTAVQTTTITQNSAVGNGGSGLNVDIAAATLSKNLAVANLLNGIRTPFGAIDGGGNQAHDNVAPEQCTPPIACP